MPAKRRAASPELSRLHVLAAAGGPAFIEHAVELLASRDRLGREAALAALMEHPDAAARDALRALYGELDADGLKRDQGAGMRESIVRILTSVADVRDVDIAVRASSTSEIMMGQDVARRLRAVGLTMLARIAPDVLPYYAIEHLDDVDPQTGEWEPATSAFSLLAAMEQYVPIYQWLLDVDRSPSMLPGVVELFTAAPPAIVQRFVERALDTAIRREQESLCIVLAESVVKLELTDSYDALASLLSGKISDDLYAYVALLLARTNRPPLLAILEQQLRAGRRSALVIEALEVRTTPEQQAILDRWEQR